MSAPRDGSQRGPKPDQPKVTAGQARVARKNRQLQFILIGLVVLVVAALAGVFLYQSYVGPYQRAVITVDGTAVRMGYFVNRLRASGTDAATMVQQLTYEQIVKIMAPKLGVKVTDEQINQTLRTAAERASANVTDNETAPPISDAAYQTWYKETLKETHLSTSQYREMVRVNLEASQLQYALAQQVPTSAAQVHLHVILVNTLAEANAAKARIDGGQAFADVAKAVSLDSSKDNGGDVGWRPYGTSPYDDTIFKLGVGQVSSPVAADSTNTAGQYLLFLVSEKADNRQIDPDARALLQSRALYDWIQQELPNHNIKVTNFDEQTQAWITWQLSKN